MGWMNEQLLTRLPRSIGMSDIVIMTGFEAYTSYEKSNFNDFEIGKGKGISYQVYRVWMDE